jgi:hypothetical protein
MSHCVRATASTYSLGQTTRLLGISRLTEASIYSAGNYRGTYHSPRPTHELTPKWFQILINRGNSPSATWRRSVKLAARPGAIPR